MGSQGRQGIQGQGQGQGQGQDRNKIRTKQVFKKFSGGGWVAQLM